MRDKIRDFVRCFFFFNGRSVDYFQPIHVKVVQSSRFMINYMYLTKEVKWALGSTTMNKASGGDRIPGELFQIPKDAAATVPHSICQQIWKTQQWPQGWKRSVFIPIPKKGNVKECSNYHAIAFISHTNKVMLKILQARLQQYMNHELPYVQTGL